VQIGVTVIKISNKFMQYFKTCAIFVQSRAIVAAFHRNIVQEAHFKLVINSLNYSKTWNITNEQKLPPEKKHASKTKLFTTFLL